MKAATESPSKKQMKVVSINLMDDSHVQSADETVLVVKTTPREGPSIT